MAPSATGTMDSNNSTKPFRTIEVQDRATGSIQKIACMSCIRGHRTTACGNAVCRSKIFWTVKRPGRPSNSCTCRFGASGACRCVVARSACPHKTKKGRGRAVDCRCEEQGRFCCLLEPHDWDVLCAMRKPQVQFYGSREELEGRGRAMTGGVGALPPTPAYSVASPGSVPSTPGAVQFVNANGGDFTSEMASPSSMVGRQTPRFGMMGIGAPMGDDFVGQDVLTWDGQSPPAPRPAPSAFPLYAETPFATTPHPVTSATTTTQHAFNTPDNYNTTSPFPFIPASQATTYVPPPSDYLPPLDSDLNLDIDKLMLDYLSHQFPAAICQHCGMAGCTCRACPAVMQNFDSGSWAQCCSRKHVRAGPPPQPQPQPQQLQQQMGLASTQPQNSGGGGCCGGSTSAAAASFEMQDEMDISMPAAFRPKAGGCCGGGDDSTATEAPTMQMLPDDAMDLSEFLVNDLETPLDNDGNGRSGGCCCKD